MKDLQKPLIHLNGSNPGTLREALQKAYYRCQDAMTAIADTAPNARDYYPLEKGAFERARDEHFDRLARVQAVGQELMSLVFYLIETSEK